jgi:hypothetical protein
MRCPLSRFASPLTGAPLAAPPFGLLGAGPRPFRNWLSGVQLIEQRLRLLQIARVEPFGEPAVTGANSSRACCTLPWERQRRARLMAARNSNDLACWARATASVRSKYIALELHQFSAILSNYSGNSRVAAV